MCPQANISEILLGGNGRGSEQLDALLKETPRKTIGGYFDQRVNSPHQKTGTESGFLVDVAKINPNLPPNMRLVAGDPSLEVQARAMNQIAALTLPAEAWLNVHRWLLDLVNAITIQFPSCVFFIDTNPSFGAYTELALVASNRLIVPCTADGSSARAIDNIGQLLYGLGVPAQYSNANFARLARANGLALPALHLVPMNRSTQYSNRASKAFGAMYAEIQRRVKSLRQQIPTAFSLPANQDPFLDIPDAHSVAVVASHFGRPLATIKPGPYDVHGITTQVNQEPLERYTEALGKLVALL
jgi:cellulose biosynthesis protein BcsQ